ncbi:protein RRP6-like 1 isoform X3 [Brassica napus]|uniref:protein RRP6-like 1 isoform X3 n=1 Tax=Brassica napus TaxID=3708 RepID=UPI0020790ADF|nr:protein RRP6-like 1 isoform X3 [Brassica napus]
MAADDSPGLKSLEALIGGSLPENLSKLSSTCLAIPANKDFHFLCNFDEFKLRIDEISGTSQCVLETIGGFCGKPMRYSGDDAYDWLVNLNDEVLQRIDLDLEDTMKKETDPVHGKAKVSFHIATIKKPQEEYKILVNNANVPFEHVWLEKKENNLGFIHPLEKLSVMDFVDKDISEMKPVEPLSLEGIPFTLVEEINDLKDLAAKLSSVDEFAVDLEHNQYRSFQGLTCLMQISTRTEDYIVDTFKLWDHIGTYLRDIFKDPKKKKVMHGADRDIIWLQRDFGIYVCNLFDTGQASRVLKLERKSLEFLLKHYCGVAANKQWVIIQPLLTFLLKHTLTLRSTSIILIACRYQNADWRIRPLPDVMTRYAREDTHYLLYIYDVMRVDLHTVAKEDEKPDSPLVEVYKRSYDVCMQLYEKELLTENSYLHINGVQAANFNAVQLAIVAGLCEWRDRIARADDESTGYVLPNKTLLEIAKEMPINVGKLRRLLKSKLPYIERNVDAVISVIRRSMQNAAAFEPVVQSLKTWHPGTVENDIGGVRTTVLYGSGKVSVDVSEEQSGGFGALPSKRKFGSENKANEEVKVSKSKPACVSKPDEVIILSDDSDEYAADSVSETPFKGPDVKTFGPDIIVLDDDDSDDDDSDDDSETGDGREREVERMNMISEQQGKFMSLKPGFLNI